MTDNDKSRLQKEGSYIRHLQEEQKMSVRDFADRLDVSPNYLETIENGDVEAPDKVVVQLPGISNAYEITMERIFGERWVKLKAVYWLASEVSKRRQSEVYIKHTKTRQCAFHGPKVFGYAHITKSGVVVAIETNRNWSDKAAVTNTSNRQTENGWWDEPNAFWDVDVRDTDRMKFISDILAKVCEARHAS